jgi:HK97 family phage portal protein
MIVRTFDGLQALMQHTGPTFTTQAPPSLQLYDSRQSYAEIYRRQPSVRICCDFIERGISDVPLHWFRRVSDTDRQRLAGHDAARWLAKPNVHTSGFRLKSSLAGDLALYHNAYWLKARGTEPDGRPRLGLVRLPPEQMHVRGALLPTMFEWTPNAIGKPVEFPPSEIVHLHCYNPLNPLMGISPLETLRAILAEEAAAADHREGFWRNSARIEGVVTRPATAKRYSQPQVEMWRAQWQATYAGGARAGKALLLQDGETFTSTAWSPRDAEYIAGAKLRRELCPPLWGIPLPLVGILDHATFSNIREQHKHLYQDCLGPWLAMIESEMERQLLPECEDVRDVYCEFNIAVKLAGTPEERAESIRVSTGRPWRTGNEARALDNLPRVDDPEMDRVAPQQGGPADGVRRGAEKSAVFAAAVDDDNADALIVTPVVEAMRVRLDARLAKLPAETRALAFDADRWRREVVLNLTPLVGADRAATVAARVVCAEQQRLETEHG